MFQSKFLTTTLAAAALTVVAGTAGAVTTFDVSDNPGGQALADETGIADGGLFSQGLTTDDSVSINIDSDGQIADSEGAIGFTFSPSPLRANMSVALSSTDFGIFGDVDIHLSTSASTGDSFAMASTSGAGVYDFFGVEAGSPLYVIFDWENDVDGSFNADIMLSAVPVPAAGFLLLGGLGGMAALRRRRKKS